MALQATFTASFAEFDRAVESAAAGLTQKFEVSAKGAQAALERMSRSFAGEKLIKDAQLTAAAIEKIGGASRLTESEQRRVNATIDEAIAKYRALGQSVPPSIVKISSELQQLRAEQERAEQGAKELAAAQQKAAKDAGQAFQNAGKQVGSIQSALGPLKGAVAGAFSVGAVAAFASKIVGLAGEINDLADRLGIGATAVQELGFAAKSTGSSVQALQQGVAKLSEKLIEGQAGTVTAFKELGLSLEQIRQLKTEDAFTAVADAIARVPEPMKQSQLAMELFGNSGIELLPAMKAGIGELRQEAQRLGQVMSEDTVKALDEFGDNWEQAMTQAQVAAATTAVKIRGFLSGDFLGLEGWQAAARAANAEAQEAARVFASIRPPAQFRPETSAPPELDLEAIVDGWRRAAEASKKYAAEIRALIDKAVGADPQQQIKKLRDAFASLTPAQKENATIVRALLTPYEDLRQQVQDLPRELERARSQFQKPLASRDLFTTTIQGADGVVQSFRAFVGLAPDLSKATQEFKNQLAGLTKDGLLPVSKSFAGVATEIEAFAVRSRKVAPLFREVGTTFAEEMFQGFNSEQLGARLTFAIEEAIRAGGGAAGVVRAAGREIGQQFAENIGRQASASLGGFLGGVVGVGAGFLIDQGVQTFAAFLEDENDQIIAAQALRNQLIRDFGSQQELIRQLTRAGVGNRQADLLLTTGDPEQFARTWTSASEQLQRFREQLDGLATAAGGVNTIAEVLGASFERSAKEQAQTVAEGAAQILTATDDQVAAFNRLGLFAGATIANLTGRTGDLVGAILQVGPAIEQLIKARDQFGLADQASAATLEVIKFYETVTNNQDVFKSISGTGQLMEGLGLALVKNSELANAFGEQFAADLATLQARGVDTTEAMALMAPQLQRLWELAEDGKVTVNETTKALLEQAEAQGVVGDEMRSVNDQILEVLTEIRDMFSQQLPGAIPRTAAAISQLGGQGGQAIDRIVRQLGEDLPDAAERAGRAIREKIPRTIPINIEFNYDELPPDVARPNAGGDLPSFANGGIGNFGRGTLAVLHGREAIIPLDRAGNPFSREQVIVVNLDKETLISTVVRGMPDYVTIRTGRSF